MFRYWFYVIVAMSGVLFLSACTQPKGAPVEFKGGKFFGKDGHYDSKGNEVAKYSKDNPAILNENIADKYTSKDESYGVAAEVDSIGSSDLPSPEMEVKSWTPPVAESNSVENFADVKDTVDTAKDPAPVKYMIDPIPKPYVPVDRALVPENKPVISEVKPEEVIEELVVEQKKDKVTKTPDFIWPVRGKTISNFGNKQNGKVNKGINISARSGEPIRSSADGVVVYADNKLENYGNLVIIKHNNGYLTAYAHAKDTVVNKGDEIIQGQLLGFVGDSGAVDKSQLHFAIRKDKQPLNPLGLLSDD